MPFSFDILAKLLLLCGLSAYLNPAAQLIYISSPSFNASPFACPSTVAAHHTKIPILLIFVSHIYPLLLYSPPQALVFLVRIQLHADNSLHYTSIEYIQKYACVQTACIFSVYFLKTRRVKQRMFMSIIEAFFAQKTTLWEV